MKRKVQISLVIHINATDDSGVTHSHPAVVVLESEVDISPMEPGYTVTGTVPNAFDEIVWEDVETKRYCRQRLRS